MNRNRPLDYQLNTETWEEVRKYLVDKAIIVGDTINNRKWPWFWESREALLDSGYLTKIAEMLWIKIKKYNPEVLYGKGYGATMLLISLQMIAERENYPIKILMCREKRKERNRRKLIEGPKINHIARAVFVDDTFVIGDTYKEAVQYLKEEKYKLQIVAITCMFDFWNYKGTRRQEILGMPVERLYTRHDLGLTRIDPLEPVLGKLLWRNLAHNQWLNDGWYKCPPKIYQNRLFFANDRHEVFCHDLNSGDIIWKVKGPMPFQDKGICAELQIQEEKIYISSYDGNLYSRCIHTGEKFWSVKLDGFLHSTPYINADKREIYIATEGGTRYKRGDIAAVNMDTGKVLWRYPTNHVVPASPFLFQDQVVCGSNDGNIYSIKNGLLQWRHNIGILKGRPNNIDDVLLACTEMGRIFAFSSNGEILWEKGAGTMSAHQFLPVHKELGLVYILNEDGFCLAYNKHGQKIWIRQLRGRGRWGLKLVDNHLMAVTASGYVVILDAQTGNKIAMSNLDTLIFAPPEFTKSHIAFHCQSQGLKVFERAN